MRGYLYFIYNLDDDGLMSTRGTQEHESLT